MKKPLMILAGPTAVGKTALSVALAKKLNGSIISADSMQVYRGMDIGTAKITREEMQGIPHYLISCLDPSEEFSVYTFQKMAQEALLDIEQAHRLPILTGGTGFYIQALLREIDFTKSSGKSKIRSALEEEAEKKGAAALHDRLCMLDPASGSAIHPNNVKRVIRALEYYLETGSRISEHNEQQRRHPSPFDYLYFVITDDRKRLYDRIDARIDQMIQDGLYEEVCTLIQNGLTKDHISMKGLGYREWFPYFNQEASREDVISEIKKNTRHFAKRQLTWFKRERDAIWIDRQAFQNDEDIVQHITEIWKNRQLIKNRQEVNN